MSDLRTLTVSERLAGLAGVAAALASLAGFIPGVYRDPAVIIVQSHGYDAGNLVVVVVLWVALASSARGSIVGRQVAVGALGCLLYSFVTYGFEIVLNPATFLYIAVLGLGGWSMATGLASVGDDALRQRLAGSLPRRATAALLIVMAALFALTWLSQMGGALASGGLPAELADAGWPTNPVWVEDLGFVLPLMVVTGWSLVTGRPLGLRLAVPLLAFMALLSVTILAMAVTAALDGQAIVLPMIAIFVTVAALSLMLIGLTLTRGPRVAESPAS
jgi:hypothetical protein